jgi:hypothetical protein
MAETIELFLDLLGSGMAALARFLAGVDLWPVIVLALGLLLLLLIVPIALRLHRMSHQLRELSNVVQRQAQAIQQLSALLNELNEDLAPAPPVLPFRGIAEDQSPNMVQSADGPVDLEVQLKLLRETMLAQTSKDD